MCGVNPFTPIRVLDDAELARIIDVSRTTLRQNVSGHLTPMTTFRGLRRTTGRDDPSSRLWIYGRGRLPCRKCGAPISVRSQGTHARLTYWCENCQPARHTRT